MTTHHRRRHAARPVTRAAEHRRPGRAPLLQRVLLPRTERPARRCARSTSTRPTDRLHVADRAPPASVPAGAEISFATYFNAFPAALLAALDDGAQRGAAPGLRGSWAVDVYRSKADGDVDARRRPRSPATADVEFELDLTPFVDGGWYWFDVTADGSSTLVEAGWYAAARRARGPTGRRHLHLQPSRRLRRGAWRPSRRTRWSAPSCTAVVVADQGNQQGARRRRASRRSPTRSATGCDWSSSATSAAAAGSPAPCTRRSSTATPRTCCSSTTTSSSRRTACTGR